MVEDNMYQHNVLFVTPQKLLFVLMLISRGPPDPHLLQVTVEKKVWFMK